MSEFTVAGTSDKIWNLGEFLDFLIANQHSHIQITINPEAICLKNLGVYKLLDKFSFTQVDILTRNPFEQHEIYNILCRDNNQWFKKIETIDTRLHKWNQHKIFYCLFGRPTASRVGLASYFLSKHPDITHLHFSATPEDTNLIDFELDKLLEYNVSSVQQAGNLITQLPVLLSSPERYTNCNGYDYSDPLTNLYQDIFIDILSESHVLGNTFFATEKTIRPMWLKKPFIVFASKNYLCYLRQMGFRTFADFWSEDYDGYEGRERFIKILELINNLAQHSKSELQRMYCNMQYTLDYNYNLLLTQNYQNIITYIP